MVTTLAAIGALWFTSQSLRATDNQYALAQQTEVTDRFQKAAEELSSDKIDVRLAGIYLMERLSKDSPSDYSTVFAVISAFLRTHATASECPTASANSVGLPVDVQAVLTVIERRDVGIETPNDKLDLSQTCLSGAQLENTEFVNVDLTNTNLSEARLIGATFQQAPLDRANLTDANLFAAHLAGEYFSDATLTNTDFSAADLRGAVLQRANLGNAIIDNANLQWAFVVDANLTGADLNGANLSETDLSRANLTGATLKHANLSGATLTSANLTNIEYDNQTRWPTGFTPPPTR